MTAVWAAGRKIALDPARLIGQGGEAEVYDIGDGLALKSWKGPGHADYHNQPEAQAAAAARIDAAAQRLADFPVGLPERVIAPRDPVTDGKRCSARVVGYTMKLLAPAEPLYRLTDRGRISRFSNDDIRRLFLDLHATITALHARGVVVGDFHDLNVLVCEGAAYRFPRTGLALCAQGGPWLIDADSFQFGRHAAVTFTERFVDPTLCDPAATTPRLIQRYRAESDWYAFAVMLMQCLLFVGPWGGVHRPKPPATPVAAGARSLARLSVFHPDVRYPRPAIPYRVLPDELLSHFQRTFVEDLRAPFPRALLDSLSFRLCADCGVEHAHLRCPLCTTQVAAAPAARVRGRVTAEDVLTTRGRIVAAAVHDGRLVYLVHEDGVLRREDGAVVSRPPLDGARRSYALSGAATLISTGDTLVTLRPGRAPERLSVDAPIDHGPGDAFAASARRRYWVTGGQLLRDGDGIGGFDLAAPVHIGDVLARQTRVWTGERFGFGFYRAGRLAMGFLFDAERRGLRDGLALPPLAGELCDTHAAFADDRVWWFAAVQHGGRRIHRITVIHRGGDILACEEATLGDGSLAGAGLAPGALAMGDFLLAATDDGIVRLGVDRGRIVKTREYPDTAPFVDAGTAILPAPGGLYAVTPQAIRLLRLD